MIKFNYSNILKSLVSLKDGVGYYELFIKTIAKLYNNENSDRKDENFDPKGILNLLSCETKTFSAVYNYLNTEIYWHSSNVEILGYNRENFTRPSLHFFTQLHPKYWMLFMQTNIFTYHFLKKISTETRKEGVAFHYYGVEMKHPKTGKIHFVSLRYLALDYTSNDMPYLYLLIMEDISHYYKGEKAWFRIEVGKKEKHIAHIISGDLKLTEHEIFSDRELEIISLINQNMDSEEIAKKLFLSVHTIEKHRKNIINRIGVKNTIGVVDFARKYNIISFT